MKNAQSASLADGRATRPWGRPVIRVAGCALACILGITALRAAPPGWLLADAQLPPLPPALAKGESDVEVLRDEIIVTISPRGEWKETQRYAVRVLAARGSEEARMRVDYVEKSDSIVAADAWLVRAGRQVAAYPKKQWVDVARLNQTTLFTDIRWLGHGFINASDAVAGDVYGGEVTVVRRHNAGQMQMVFGGGNPLRRGRVEFRVPAGWEPDLFWLQGSGPAPVVSPDRSCWTWEVADIPAVKSEMWAPNQAGLYVASVIVRAGAQSAAAGYPDLKTWGDYARWADSVHSPQCNTAPGLKAMAAKLTAGLTDPWQKLTALCGYAQRQLYIQQYNNTGLGFGYRPRLATEVLATGYGDCKDKANLLRALLREAGYQSYFVVVRYSPGNDVKPEWPGQQFNHAIVAISVPSGINHPAIVTHPLFGRLLYFDPTNPWVPLGQLPWYEHGGLAMICDSRETALTTMPSFPPEQAWSSEAEVDLEMRSATTVHGVLVEKVAGEPAARARRRAAEDSPVSQRQFWIDRLKTALNGVRVADPAGEELVSGGYETKLGFAARAFGQWAQDKLFVVRLDVLTRGTVSAFTNRKRAHPILVKPVSDRLTVRFALPPAMTVAELPPVQKVDSEFGRYEGVYSVVDGWLVFRRSLTLFHATIPASKYEELQAFMLAVAKAEATSVALVRAPVAPPAAH